jgi:hypothetical protein
MLRRHIVLISIGALAFIGGCSRSAEPMSDQSGYPKFTNTDIRFAYITRGFDDGKSEYIYDTAFFRVDIDEARMQIGRCRSLDSLREFSLCGTFASGTLRYSSSYPKVTSYTLYPDKDWKIEGVLYSKDTLIKNSTSSLRPNGALNDSGYASFNADSKDGVFGISWNIYRIQKQYDSGVVRVYY